MRSTTSRREFVAVDLKTGNLADERAAAAGQVCGVTLSAGAVTIPRFSARLWRTVPR